MTLELPLRGTGLALAGSTLLRIGGSDVRARMPFEDLADALALAEETGYRSVWVPDHGVWEPFSLLAALGQRSRQIALATGVVTMRSRSPEAMAAAANTLAELCGDRFVLGVGSGPETRLGRVSEYLGEVRGSLQEGIPLYLATVGPRIVEHAGMIPTAGILLNWCTPARVERARAELARHGPAIIRVNRPRPPSPSVAVYVRACLGHDPDHALEALRPMVAMYASIPSYRRQLAEEGLGDLAQAAAEARARDDPSSVADELVDALCVRGTRDQALARFEEYRAAGADLVIVYPVTAQEPASSLMGTIMGAAPDPAVEA